MATRTAIWVPMKLDAFLNLDSRRISPNPDPRQRAYLSPITVPNLDGLQLNNDLVQHDIFEHHRNAPYMGCADRYRQTDSRQGIYLHWSLPRMYRLGVTGSSSQESKATVQNQRLYGGYPSSNPGSGKDIGTPVFRPVPNRWVIMRTVRPAVVGNGLNYSPIGKIMVRDGISEKELPSSLYTPLAQGSSVDPKAVRDFFVIEGDCVRNISSLQALEDIEVTASPLIDAGSNLAQQGQTFLGRSTRLTDWTGSGDQPPPNPLPVTVSKAANPFFADYQPQNSSVFSFFDDLSIPGQGTKYTQASISYTVVGYHTIDRNDPLFVDINYVKDQTFADRLARCSLDINNTLSVADSTFLNTASGATARNMRTLCNGSLYGLTWSNPPVETPITDFPFVYPGDVIQQLFTSSHPIAVGTNPIDALFGWLRSTNDADSVTTPSIRQDLLKIQTLVLDLNDDVDSQLQAADLLATNNFVPRVGGVHWHFKAPDGVPDDTQPTIPTDTQAKGLRDLNATQSQLDAVLREQQRLQGELFSAWWTYMSDRSNPSVDANALKQQMAAVVSSLKQKLRANSNDKSNNDGLIKTLADSVQAKQTSLGLIQAGTQSSFFTQRDPTLFVAGLSSKWPKDWDQNLNVRMNPQINRSSQQPGTPSWPPFDQSIFQSKVPSSISSSVSDVLGEAEFRQLNKQAFQSTPEYWQTGDITKNVNNYENGWFPLFIEWEVEYYHIPFENWTFAPQGPEARIGYGLTPEANPSSSAIQADYRILNGRCPVLPQTAATLEATLKQVFSKINPDQNPIDSGPLIDASKSLDFSSTPLSGLTDQLLTRMQGTHVLPLTLAADGTVQVVPEAQPIGTEVGLNDSSDFLLMSGQTSKTPFASLVDLPANPSQIAPMKPVTHGQFRFTKLNIIDKFGQIVQGIQLFSSTNNSIGPTATPLFPCLGDSYSVEKNSDNVGTAKVVLPRTDDKCAFVQLPPCINQDVRINAFFLKEDTPPQWRALDEWENPVRGWLIINQMNVSFQIFTPDGEFVREYSVANQNPRTRPFPVDSSIIGRPDFDPLLRSLLERFNDPGYIAGLFRAITSTTEAIQANPSSYAESMLSVIGRPLALTTFGMNMELADLPLANQSTIGKLPPPKALTSYNFGLKIGDKDNVFDGLYGYFMAAPDVSNGVQVNWNDFYTYHMPSADEPKIAHDPARPIPTDTTITPFYPDPHASTPDAYELSRLQNMEVFVGLIDPFTAVNCYTALLPIKQLKLPPWTIEHGLKEISTFFQMGPLLIPGDVPPYDATKQVKSDYRLDDDTAPAPNGQLAVPNVGIGEWAWLQAYDQSAGTVYNAMDVVPVSGQPGFEPGPYTAVEGFLQQKKPFTKPDELPVEGL